MDEAVNLTFVDPCVTVRFIKKNQEDATLYQNFIISCLCEAQHVLGDTPPIIRSPKLHWQPLVFRTRKVDGREDGGRCQVQYVPDNVHQLHVQQRFAYAKPEAAETQRRPLQC
jgi:hypothetical protein